MLYGTHFLQLNKIAKLSMGYEFLEKKSKQNKVESQDEHVVCIKRNMI